MEHIWALVSSQLPLMLHDIRLLHRALYAHVWSVLVGTICRLAYYASLPFKCATPPGQWATPDQHTHVILSQGKVWHYSNGIRQVMHLPLTCALSCPRPSLYCPRALTKPPNSVMHCQLVSKYCLHIHASAPHITAPPLTKVMGSKYATE